MPEIRIFISSVQKEFREERQFLWQYIQSDPLLGAFFKPFLFENQPASSTNTETAYLEEVSASDIYLGILGNTYGFEDKNGISPTEKEFDLATSLGKERLLYIMGTNDTNKHPKEKTFINKIGIGLVRKRCTSFSDLRSGIYASLVKYLQDHEYIRTGPFDASLCRDASFNDIDREKVFKSWDSFRLPKIGAKIFVSYGNPIWINSKEEIESKFDEVQKAMEELTKINNKRGEK